MFGLAIIKESELPFYRDIKRLIDRRPEYAEGIKEGVVHLAFLPGYAPKKAVETAVSEVGE